MWRLPSWGDHPAVALKRSQQIRLLLSGAIAAGASAGCGRDSGAQAPVSAENVYTNNHYLQGAGYYHAPYHAWYPHPLNYYDAGRGYYHGGQWSQTPEPSGLASSRPTPDAARLANSAARPARSTSAVSRRGFGHFGRFAGS